MARMRLTRDIIIEKSKPVLNEYKIKTAYLFGSYARDTATNKSDIDLAIIPSKEMSIFDIMRIQLDLQDIFKKKVDFATIKELFPDIKEDFERSKVAIYE